MIITKQDRWINLDNLNTKIYHNRYVMDWITPENIGKEIYFEYKNIKGILKFVKYDKPTKNVIVEYKNKEYGISCNNLKNCQIGNVVGAINHDYYYNVGDIVEVNSGKVEIIEQIRIQYKKYSMKGYMYKCVKCSNIHRINEADLKNGVGCNVCCPSTVKVLKGVNDIATTHPHLVKYFKNIEDTYINTYSSHNKILMKCPDCGFEKEMKINTLQCKGFSCKKCGDGSSYPSKFVFNVLEQLEIDFETEKYFEWSNINNELNGRKIYDFCFKLNGEQVLIEVNGLQHYEERGRQEGRHLKEEQANDKLKKQLALSNGIKEENYIVIDCKDSNLEYIKNSILNNEKMINNFNLNNIDWLKCEKFALSNRVKEACDLWNQYENVTEISEIMKLNRATIRIYLKKGNNLRWCNYDSKLAQTKNSSNGKLKIMKVL